MATTVSTETPFVLLAKVFDATGCGIAGEDLGGDGCRLVFVVVFLVIVLCE